MEMLLSVALIAIVAGISMPVYYALQVRSDLDITVTEIVQTARRAELMAQANESDDDWGVRLNSGSLLLFKGDSYATRDQDFDEVIDIPSNISFGGLNEIVFEKFSGVPSASGTITVNSIINESINITINEKGGIDY